MFEVVFSFYLI